MKRKIALILIFISAIVTAQVKELNIDLKSIKSSDGKITLNLIKTWGSDIKSKDEVFKSPADICIDSRGNYYVADSGENQILVFDKNGKLLKKTGRKGAGPGDLNFPVSVSADSKDNILVSELLNKRIQIFCNNKKPQTLSFNSADIMCVEVDNKDRIALKSKDIVSGSPKIRLYDYEKKELGTIGKTITGNMTKKIASLYNSAFEYCTDKEGNYYIGNIYGNPSIEKYSGDGKMICKINYQISPKPAEIKMTGRSIITDGGGELRSMDVDNDGNLYLLIKKEGKNADDSKYLPSSTMTMNKGGITSITRTPPKERKNKFDWFQIIVFDKNGNLKGSKTIDVYADKIRVLNNNLFVINSNLDAVIYQYKVIFK